MIRVVEGPFGVGGGAALLGLGTAIALGSSAMRLGDSLVMDIAV